MRLTTVFIIGELCLVVFSPALAAVVAVIFFFLMRGVR